MERRILIIDDEVDFCGIMKNYFQKRAYDAEVAHTIREGKGLLRSNQPQILFLDNNLPDGNGWEIVDWVVELIPQVKIFLISAHRSPASFSGDYKNVLIWEKPISLHQLNEVFGV